MFDNLNFRVHSRLADLLGEEYRSSERALKELVDNAWDADADNVFIVLPQNLGDDTIVVSDDGDGMTTSEVSSEYLNIARDRRMCGERTAAKNRKIKGRKGIGKFAGLTIANKMIVQTKKDGIATKIVFDRSKIVCTDCDIEEVPLPIFKESCPEGKKGTNVRLEELNQYLELPDPERLKELLSLDYGREFEFKIFINGEPLKLENYPGDFKKFEFTVPNVGPIGLKLKILDTPNRKHSGAYFKFNNKLIDQKDYLGIEELEDIPEEMKHRFMAEVDVESEDKTLSGDSDFLNISSKAFKAIKKVLHDTIKSEILTKVREESSRKYTVFTNDIEQRINCLDSNKQNYLKRVVEKIYIKFYRLSQKQVHFIISLMIDALEYNDENKKS